MLRKAVLIIILITTAFLMHAMAFADTYGQLLCKKEGYECKRIRGNQSWSSLWPDAHERDMEMRINRMNTPIYSGMKIAVADNLDIANIMDFSPFPLHIPDPQEKVIMVDPINIAWGAYAPDGKLIRWGPISAGADYCKDIHEPCHTHTGTFRIFSLGSSDCISRKFPLPKGGAPMPYCMYFNNGQALHGEPNGLPGYNASHGCVRLYVNDAEWLRYDFVEGPNASNSYRGTKVIVGPYNSDDNEDDDDDDNNARRNDHDDNDDNDESDPY